MVTQTITKTESSTAPPVHFGIAGFGYAFGEDTDVAATAADYVDDPQRVTPWGCHTYHRAPDGVGATELATEAARQALARIELTPDDVDALVLATAEMPEYSYYDTAAGVARELKIERTQTLLLSEGCGAGTTGFSSVAGIFALQPEVQTVVFIAVNRVSEFHRNRMNVNASIHSDGAVAVVCLRDHPHNQWLATDQFIDPEYCQWFQNDYGGAVNPVPPDDYSSRTAMSGNQRAQEHFGRDPRRLRAFMSARNELVVEAVDRACARAGLTRDDVTHVIYINDKSDTVMAIADPLGVPIERTNAEFTGPHGHMGAADQLISFGLLSDRGDVKPGDVVALCGISTGMRWLCTLIEA